MRSAKSRKKLPGRVGLPSQLADAGRDVDVIVRVALEHRADERQVLRRTAHVGADERGLRVTTDDPVEGGQDLVEGREAGLGVVRVRPARRPEVPVGMRRELLPALVALVERVEEGDRVGDMDDDGQAQARTDRPERVEALVVDGDDACRRGRARAGRAASRP